MTKRERQLRKQAEQLLWAKTLMEEVEIALEEVGLYAGKMENEVQARILTDLMKDMKFRMAPAMTRLSRESAEATIAYGKEYRPRAQKSLRKLALQHGVRY